MQQIQQYSIQLHVNDCRLHCAIYISAICTAADGELLNCRFFGKTHDVPPHRKHFQRTICL